MIRSVPLAAGEVVGLLRRPVEPLIDRNGQPVVDRRTGEIVHAGELVVAGLLPSAFADTDRPEAIRLRMNHAPGIEANAVVRLGGAVKLTSWYQPRARGADASSEVTISATSIERATGARPLVRGGLPVDVPPGMLLGQFDGQLDIVFPAEGTFAVDGVALIRCAATVPDDVFGQDVRLVEARAFYTIPHESDVGRTAKSEVVLRCANVEPAHVTNGSRSRKQPEPVAADTSAEG